MKVKSLLLKYKQIILYIIFGACTVIVNTIIFDLLFYCLVVPNVLSNIIAWIVAVIFAFVTNKFIVFESNKISIINALREAVLFFLCRVFTGVIDVLIMYYVVDVLSGNAFVWKIISNTIVIVINYVASKLLIFTKCSGNQ